VTTNCHLSVQQTQMGVHLKVVQDCLGYSTLTTTINIYSHVPPTLQRSAIVRFAAHFGA